MIAGRSDRGSTDGLLDEARALDVADPLRELRSSFLLPEGLIYLDGNSLGALSEEVDEVVHQTVDREWGAGLVGSWNDAGWFDLPTVVGERVARLIGASAGQVIVCDTTTINLYKVLSAALAQQTNSGRRVVLMLKDEFPANLYVAQGLLDEVSSGMRRVLVDAQHLSEEIQKHAADLAVVCVSHVGYRSGRVLDLPAITREAHAAGALVIWDLCHSAGVFPLALDDWRVDYAVGCSYKYLNGGPGAPAWLYVSKERLPSARPRLAGWMGHADPFAFAVDYAADAGIRRFLSGTPHIVSMRALQAALRVYEGVDLGLVREKSMRLGELFRRAVEEAAADLGQAANSLQLLSPISPQERGSQVTYLHPHGQAIVRALYGRLVIGDFRAPDGMRFGFSPLYVSHQDAVIAARRLMACIRDRVWTQQVPTQEGRVT